MDHTHVKDIGLESLFGMTWSKQSNGWKRYYCKASTENSILKKRNTQNDSHKQCARIL